MKNEEVIARYGDAEYNRRLEYVRLYYKAHKEEIKAHNKKYKEEHREEIKETGKKYREEHKEEIKAHDQEICRKGGKHYDKHRIDNQTGIQGAKNRIRRKHAHQYEPYKAIIAQDSQLHHEWIPQTAYYRGVALVEKDQHMHGFIDVIQILDGKITLLTEEEVKKARRGR